jgi:hypothetical protein
MNNPVKNPKMWVAVFLALAALLAFALFRASRVVVHRPWPLAPGEAERLGLSEPLAASLALASLAPSSHNTQPWKVRVLSDREVSVLLDEGRLLPAVDPERREALVSVGAFLENLVQGAAAMGLKAEVEPTIDDPAGIEVARVRFEPGNGTGETKILEAILARDTFRGPLPADALPDETVQALAGTALSRWAFFPSGSPAGKWIREALGESNRVQASRDDAMEELAAWIRFSPGAVARHRDGLTTSGMGLPAPIRAFMALFFNEKSVTGKAFREAGARKAREQAEACAGFFVLESPDGSPRSAVQAGRDLESFWLEAVLRGVAVHPMSQVLEESPWKEEVATRLGTAGTVQMLLRVGLANSPARPVSPRRPLDSFVEKP